MSLTFEALEPEYRRLWADVHVRGDRKSAAMATARRINEGRTCYLAVTKETGVPWPVIGIIHAMECGLDFSRHLHNGDRLTARTRQVPKGRPLTGEPPFTWEESAADAVRCDHLDKCTEWTIPRLLWQLEGYNGWGYRRHHPDVLSPYLWSGTQHSHLPGKYTEDGKWDARAVSGQSGAAAIITCLIEINPEVEAAFAAGVEQADKGALAFAKAYSDSSLVAGDSPSGEPAAGDETVRAVTRASLMADGSRSMTMLQRLQATLASLGIATTGLSVTDGFGLVGEWTNGLKILVADHAMLLMLGGLGAGGLVVYLAQGYLVAAARDGRYTPRGS